MWITQLILIVIGISSGAVIASGLFSFIIGLGIVSKFADRTKTGDKVLLYENAIALGGVLGSIVFIYDFPLSYLYYFMPLMGISAGIFVGCWAMSIAEVINIFPVLIRRVRLVHYIKYIVLAIAVGKGVGMYVMCLLN
ncbi:MAG: stage V sporulation protein AB [Eubacteriales bacterium]